MPVVLHVRTDRQIHRPYGLAGGGPGSRSWNLIRRADGTVEEMPPMFSATLAPGDVFHHVMPGGGGWGDPLDRHPDAVAADVANDKISGAAASEKYGVVLLATGAVDVAATAARRSALRRNTHMTTREHSTPRLTSESTRRPITEDSSSRSSADNPRRHGRRVTREE
jgi:N-methylhydantoinase B